MCRSYWECRRVNSNTFSKIAPREKFLTAKEKEPPSLHPEQPTLRTSPNLSAISHGKAKFSIQRTECYETRFSPWASTRSSPRFIRGRVGWTARNVLFLTIPRLRLLLAGSATKSARLGRTYILARFTGIKNGSSILPWNFNLWATSHVI